MKTKITLSGEVASGKTTVGKLLAKKLNYDFISLGTIVRERAEKEGLHILEFQEKCQQNPEMDLEIDRYFANFCNAKDSLVIDYRMGFKFVTDAHHVFLKISEQDAVNRLKTANRINESYKTVGQRNESFKSQFQTSYRLDYTAENHYDLIVSIDGKQTAEEITDTIINHIITKNNEKQNYSAEQ
ncbi:cytidylate kinase family protein [Chryseobacterium caseinilyticum]|uniref:Cytidylate kinase family protein n=1 Tax=Chryseobacterium caseinilyticum TaxID=2771428 RepID=A0ABR8Z6L3_9FLAO|nr:cytidylate kinase family protein [Chryseobacterium caseinilyticum]MBD8080898.1 cytidylate kinase family protein [Chryseobacterium caseinilyticum]